jgi:AP-1 complex subunit mu
MSAVEKFPILLSEAEEESSAVPPCFSDEGINVCEIIYILLRHGPFSRRAVWRRYQQWPRCMKPNANAMC